jgi:hypothetical protein
LEKFEGSIRDYRLLAMAENASAFWVEESHFQA